MSEPESRRREEGLFDLLTQDGASTMPKRIVNRRVPQFLFRWIHSGPGPRIRGGDFGRTR